MYQLQFLKRVFLTARINRKGTDTFRAPYLKEQDEWEEALVKPGSSITTSCNLQTCSEKEGMFYLWLAYIFYSI